MADRERRRLALVGGAIGVLLLLAVLAGPEGAPDAVEDPRTSSYLSGAHGTRALFLAMRDVGLPVTRNRLRWDLGRPADVKVVIAPTLPPDSASVAALAGWIEGGGTLILGVSSSALPILEALERDPAAPDALPDIRTVEDLDGVTARPTGHPWTTGVDSVPGVLRVFDARPPVGEVLLESARGEPVLVTFPAGDGRVVAWSDPGLLTNSRLREAPGPAAVTARAAAGSRTAATDVPPSIVFDEFHHGFRGEGSPARTLADFLVGTGWGRWLLQGLVAALALLLLVGHRFGAPLDVRTERVRPPLEHMEALAAIYMKAGAHRTTRRLLLSGLDRRLGQKAARGGTLKLPPSIGAHPAAKRVEREWARGDDADLEALSRAMDDLILETEG